MRSMSEERAGPSSLLVGLLVMLGVVLFLYFYFFAMRGPSVEPLHSSETIRVRVGENKYFLRDEDHDGHVDQLVRPPVIFGAGGSYCAEGAPQRRRMRGCKTMREGMRPVLDALLAVKTKSMLGGVGPLDEDGDGTPDCLVSVSVPRTVLARRLPSTCGSLDVAHAVPMSPGDLEAAKEIAMLEEQLRGMLQNR